ncbi:hypothetical protein SD77_2693 [Bacillus badius]|uniref:Ribose 5-phosphate isomerase B n=1 Tax=Bacillus badius TaxID=1455 RepID=A0ABR5APT1_BACBA|nr:hypothetical protein SD78_4436 [Bacillus badius]KIL75853.1 hypothetical protein SD77_2693 [Bacillus badius]
MALASFLQQRVGFPLFPAFKKQLRNRLFLEGKHIIFFFAPYKLTGRRMTRR